MFQAEGNSDISTEQGRGEPQAMFRLSKAESLRHSYREHDYIIHERVLLKGHICIGKT